MSDKFTPEVIENLKHYVYRLIDPRNGETFYVGRGVGNRVYQHASDELGSDADELSDKLQRIRQIRLAGFVVAHVIHRHGMAANVAAEVEAALIDAYPGLTNIMNGDASGDRGVMHAEEIIQKYHAQPADFKHRILLISVNRSSLEQPLYEATRFAWRLGNKARQAEYVLACVQGIIRGAFVPEKWMAATTANFPGRVDEPTRLGFEGRQAPSDIQNEYVGKRVPDNYRFGTANPVRYTW